MARKPINKCSAAKKSSFFKVLLGDFSKRLLIPSGFTKNFVSNEQSPHECVLRGPNGLRWAVELERTENGLFFQNGWQCFVKDHHLEFGDFLIFRYDGESKFTVVIYDRSACEKDVVVAKRRSNYSSSLRKKGNQEHALVTENYKNIDSKGEAVVANEKGNDAVSGERPANGHLEETSDGSILFKSENPCFRRVLTKHSFYHLGFPKKLGVAEGLMNKAAMKLEDPTGRSWPVSLCASKFNNKDGTLYERLDLTAGWSQFRVASKISPGDTIIFELVKQRVMKVHIIRVGSLKLVDRSSSVRPIIRFSFIMVASVSFLSCWVYGRSYLAGSFCNIGFESGIFINYTQKVILSQL